MKKMKKLVALLMTVAMVMGMAMTTMAAAGTLTSDITVKGLTNGVDTTVKAYQAVSYDQQANKWVVADWAKDLIVLNDDKTAYEVKDAVALGVAAEKQTATYTTTENGTEATFEDVAIGAYVILATDEKTTYTTMVANTNNEDADYIEAEDRILFAKASGTDLDKKAKEGDKFVGRGEEVEFTITTTFPNFEDPAHKDNSFKIIDTPTGLDITGVTSLTIGGAEFKDYTTSEDKTTGAYTIDLTNAIGTENTNAGKTVEVTYNAIVTSEEGYFNTANAFKNDKDYGTDTEEGFTGDITITKVAFEKENDDNLADNKKLAGAEFKVHKNDKNGEVLSFVKAGEGVYKLASATDTDTVDTIVVAEDGTVKVTGLGGGKYFFEETKAPDGYAINELGVTVTIEEKDDKNVSMSDYLVDSKLSSLPATGGIGTTIFTIGGCAIMIVAAGLFFASRRKESK